VNFTARATSRAFKVGRAPSIRRSLRIAALGLASVALGALLVLPASLLAAAEPPLTVPEARNLIKQLQKVELLKLQVGQIALAQFQNRNLDTAARLFVTTDTEGFLSQISTVQKVSENQNSALQDYQQAQANLAALQHSAETDLAALGEKEKQIKSLTAASDKKLDQAQQVLAKLTADQQKQLAEAEKKATAKANAEARAATKAPAKTNADSRATTKAPAKANAEDRRAATKGPRDSTRSSVTGTNKGAKALAYAKAQLGGPELLGLLRVDDDGLGIGRR